MYWLRAGNQFLLGSHVLDDLSSNAGKSDSEKQTDLASNGNLTACLENSDDKNDSGNDEMPNFDADGNSAIAPALGTSDIPDDTWRLNFPQIYDVVV